MYHCETRSFDIIKFISEYNISQNFALPFNTDDCEKLLTEAYLTLK